MSAGPAPRSSLSHRTRIGIKAAVLLFAVLTAAFYLLFIANTKRVPPDNILSMRANDYNWLFFFELQDVQRIAASIAGIIIFICAAVCRRLNVLSPLSPTARMISQGVVLTIGFWITLSQILRSVEWEPFYFYVSAALAFVFLWWQKKSGRLHSGTSGSLHISTVSILILGTITLLVAFVGIHHGQAIVTDAQSQIAQARLILSGRFRLPVSEELLQSAQLPNFVRENPTYSQYPPGHIILLLPFMALGLPSNLLNVLCGIVTIAFTIKLCRLIAGRRPAVLAGLLLIVSPVFLVISASGMNHGSTMTCLVISAWAFYQVLFCGRPGLLWIGVLALGWAGITRPPTALAHAIIWTPLLVSSWHKISPRHLIHAAIAGAIPLTILAIYNTLTTGNPLVLGYMVSDLQVHKLGFIFSGPHIYTPINALHTQASDILALNRAMFGWPLSSWVLLFGWLLLSRLSPGELIVLALIISQTVFFRFYHFYDLLLGPRFSSELIPCYCILAGIGLHRLLLLTPKHWRAVAIAILTAFLLAAFVYAILYWRNRLWMFTVKYVAMEEYIDGLPSPAPPRAIVIIPEYGETAGDYLFDPLAPTWFISDEAETTATLAPELKNIKWLRPPQFNRSGSF